MEYFIYKSLSSKVLGMAFAVHRALGPGLHESAYESIFAVELAHSGVFFEWQKVFPLVYRDEYVGAYIADLVVDNTIIIELKSISGRREGVVLCSINNDYGAITARIRLASGQHGCRLTHNRYSVQAKPPGGWRRGLRGQFRLHTSILLCLSCSEINLFQHFHRYIYLKAQQREPFYPG